MANKEIDLTKYEKDEYETALYGFSLNDFKQENFHFVNNEIKKSMDYMSEIFINRIKDIKPDIKEKIKSTTSEIAKKINDNFSLVIENTVNAQVEDLLSIPDNVLLSFDRVHLNPTTAEELQKLEDECNELSKTFKQNALFINLLENEWNSYDVQELLDEEDVLINKAEDFININLDTDLLKVVTDKNISK